MKKKDLNKLTLSTSSQEGRGEMKTTTGNEVHFVGIGICGQPVVQIKVSPGTKKTHGAWKLARVIRGKTAIQFGSGKKYKLKQKITASTGN